MPRLSSLFSSKYSNTPLSSNSPIYFSIAAIQNALSEDCNASCTVLGNLFITSVSDNNSDNKSLKTEFKLDSELIRKDSIIFEKSLAIIALTEILLENKLKFTQSLLPPIEIKN